jgi:hypothetical protein
MEALTALISKGVHLNLFSPIPGCSAIQRLSLYVDDVVLFVRPVALDLLAVHQLLDVFGEASGLHINYSKSSAMKGMRRWSGTSYAAASHTSP